NAHMVPFDRARRVVSIVTATDRLIARLPDAQLSIAGRTGISSRLMRRAKQRIAHSGWFAGPPRLPDAFVLEVYNPQDAIVRLSLVMTDANGPLGDRPYQRLIELEPGFRRVRIPYIEIEPHLDLGRQFTITIYPNLLKPEDEGLTLYFGLISFVLGGELA